MSVECNHQCNVWFILWLCHFAISYRILWVAYYANIWVYPILKVLQPHHKVVFILAMLVLFVFLYLLGEFINKTIWGKWVRERERYVYQCQMKTFMFCKWCNSINVIMFSTGNFLFIYTHIPLSNPHLCIDLQTVISLILTKIYLFQQLPRYCCICCGIFRSTYLQWRDNRLYFYSINNNVQACWFWN